MAAVNKTWKDYLGVFGQYSFKSTEFPATNFDRQYNASIEHEFFRSSFSNPQWRKQIIAETNAATNMSVTKSESKLLVPLNTVASDFRVSTLPNTLRVWTITGYHYPYNCYPKLNGHLVSQEFDELVRRCQTLVSKKYFRKLRELDHQFQGGVFFGEIVPTFKMLLRPMSSLRDSVSNHLKRLHKTKAREKNPIKLKKALSDAWLETSFGWQPLLSDVKDAAVALARIYNNIPRSRFKVVVVDRAHTDIIDSGAFSVPADGNLIHRLTDLKSMEYLISYYGKLKHLPNDRNGLGLLDRVVKLSGFDPSSFIPTVWELVPWSFLIDYFSNVGDVLDAYAVDTSVVEWQCQVTQIESGLTRFCKFDEVLFKQQTGAGFNYASSTVGSGKSVYRTVDRLVNPSVPYPGLQFNLGISYKQMLNIGALAAGGQILRPFY